MQKYNLTPISIIVLCLTFVQAVAIDGVQESDAMSSFNNKEGLRGGREPQKRSVLTTCPDISSVYITDRSTNTVIASTNGDGSDSTVANPHHFDITSSVGELSLGVQLIGQSTLNDKNLGVRVEFTQNDHDQTENYAPYYINGDRSLSGFDNKVPREFDGFAPFCELNTVTIRVSDGDYCVPNVTTLHYTLDDGSCVAPCGEDLCPDDPLKIDPGKQVDIYFYIYCYTCQCL